MADILPVEVNKRFITRLKKNFIEKKGQRYGFRMNRIPTGDWIEK